MSEVVVVTGASAGVGRATAREFGRRGARIGLIARGRAGLEAAAAEVRAAGGEALVLPCDVADFAAVDAAAARVEEVFGPIDVWVNVAMAAVLAEVSETSADEFRRVTEVTYLGSVHGTKAALARMFARDRGKIVQVGSALAYRGIPLQATYCGAKHAIQGFCESLWTELRHRRSDVELTVVHLPGLNTTQFSWVRARTQGQPRPVAPVYQPEIAARAIVWAAHHRRRELWVGFPTAYTIAGSRIAPWFADRYLARTAVKGQQTAQPLDPGRPDYLDAPLDDDVDHGAHGQFDGEAKRRSPQLVLAEHRRAALAVAAGAAALIAAAGSARR
ncbi:MAG TPA: SDR family oxidoreductase [Solirubrobacteraceae bacterium]